MCVIGLTYPLITTRLAYIYRRLGPIKVHEVTLRLIGAFRGLRRAYRGLGIASGGN